MVLQFLVGGIVSVINIMIHALVTVGAVGIARSAGLRHTERPRLHLMAVMVGTAAALMVAHTLEVFVWALAYAIVGAAPAGSDLLYFAFVNYTTLGYGDITPVQVVAADRADDRDERHPDVRLVDGRAVRGAAQDARTSRIDRRCLASVLQIEASELLAVQKDDLALIAANESDDVEFMQPRQCAGHGFQCQAQIVGNVAPRHRQRHDAGRRQSSVHLDQKGGDPLQRSLAAEQQHVVFRVLQVTRGHAEQVSRDQRIALSHHLEAAPLDQANRGVHDRLRRKPVLASVFQSEDVAGQVKRADLATAVRKQLVASHGADLDLIDVLRRLLFAVDFGSLSCS